MATMAMIDKRGGFLHEHRPDLFPQGFVTEEEIALWCAYYERRARESRNG
jgi:hypothetical protein